MGRQPITEQLCFHYKICIKEDDEAFSGYYLMLLLVVLELVLMGLKGLRGEKENTRDNSASYCPPYVGVADLLKSLLSDWICSNGK